MTKLKKATLSGAVVREAENLETFEIANDLNTKATMVKNNQDKEIKNSLEMFKLVPWFLSGFILDMMSFLTYGLNLNLSLFGIPKDPFGSVMLTNIGGMGIDIAWAPLCPYSRVPLLLAIGAIKDKPWVVNNEVVIRPILPIGVTFDHRMIDGIHAAEMAKEFKKCFSEPEKYLLN